MKQLRDCPWFPEDYVRVEKGIRLSSLLLTNRVEWQKVFLLASSRFTTCSFIIVFHSFMSAFYNLFLWTITHLNIKWKFVLASRIISRFNALMRMVYITRQTIKLQNIWLSLLCLHKSFNLLLCCVSLLLTASYSCKSISVLYHIFRLSGWFIRST